MFYQNIYCTLYCMLRFCPIKCAQWAVESCNLTHFWMQLYVKSRFAAIVSPRPGTHNVDANARLVHCKHTAQLNIPVPLLKREQTSFGTQCCVKLSMSIMWGLTVVVFRSWVACRAGRSGDDWESKNEKSMGENSSPIERPHSAGEEEKDDAGHGTEGVGIQRTRDREVSTSYSNVSPTE